MKKFNSVLSFYRHHRFNPVPIDLSDQSKWDLHFRRRCNLYERHLRIPISLLKGLSVLEFGCNSGENALVLAAVGSDLTLVEPNAQVLPRLKSLFKKFGLEKQIKELINKEMQGFRSAKRYDLVIAEGFLFTLPNRDKMIKKIAGLLSPGKFGVVSFNDRYGGLIEVTKRMILWRAYQLARIDDVYGKEALELAQRLYRQDFSRLNASRSFDIWWKDTMVNPFYFSEYLWSYPEILPLLERSGCEFYSSSPVWDSLDRYKWHKDVSVNYNRHKQLLDDWSKNFSFFLTGLSSPIKKTMPAIPGVVMSVSRFIRQASQYSTGVDQSMNRVIYPSPLDDYFKKCKDSKISGFNRELKKICEVAKSGSLNDLINTYHNTRYFRNLWGNPYHYICFKKSS